MEPAGYRREHREFMTMYGADIPGRNGARRLSAGAPP